MSLQLPPELLPRILDYADNSTLATCLRLSHDTINLAGKRLYHEPTFDPSIHISLLLNLSATPSSSLKSIVFSYIEHLTLYHHEESTLSSGSLELPNLKTLRLILEPWEKDSLFCSTDRPPTCPFLNGFQPTTLIIENLYSLNAILPKGLRSDASSLLSPFGDKLNRLIIKPTRFEARYTRLVPLFVQQIPDHIKEVVVIFETRPDETWPRWYQEPNEEWLSSNFGLDEFIKDLEDVVSGCGGVEGRILRLVNVGRIDAESLGMGRVGVEEMERKVKEALRVEMMWRARAGNVIVILNDYGEVVGEGQELMKESEEVKEVVEKWMGMVRFERMEDWVEQRVLEAAVQGAWRNHIIKARPRLA